MTKFAPVSAAILLLASTSLAQQTHSTSNHSATERPPEEVIDFVSRQALPSNPVMIQGEISVGQVVPSEIILKPVPGNTRYQYVVVNQHRLIIDAQSRSVVRIVN
ncbi:MULTISPECIES: DUF1236 domain-containing protein [Rhizobium]|jgi:hypothetical protein|uniref:DUF1236 domain-containing protein n=1 Tax=Rhizobium terrae TaxID=2171756 RepID=UPI000DDB83F9|nr:DUF1236 domain-containing protein [Rhizobium terrae]